MLFPSRYRLKMMEQPPSSWYKDEGGRDKCIALSAAMVDEYEQVVRGRSVVCF